MRSWLCTELFLASCGHPKYVANIHTLLELILARQGLGPVFAGAKAFKRGRSAKDCEGVKKVSDFNLPDPGDDAETYHSVSLMSVICRQLSCKSCSAWLGFFNKVCCSSLQDNFPTNCVHGLTIECVKFCLRHCGLC
jgi:hypothetical protein